MRTKFAFGFSLVELMVALVISSILMGGVLTVMSTSKKTYALQSELSVLQDNARFLIDELTREIRMAGYAGCSSISTQQLNSFLNSKNDDLPAASGFPASDSLIVVNYGQLLPLQSQPPTPLQIPNLEPIVLRDGFIPANPINQVFISDCTMAPQPYTATIAIPSSDNNDNKIIINALEGPFKKFGGGVQFFNGRNETIYRVRRQPTLGLYRCQDDNPNGGCDDLQQFDSPFIEGMESMQVRYGINTGNGTIQFVSAINQNDKVVAIRISLLMRTPNRRMNLNATDEDFYLDGPDWHYNPYKDNHQQEEGYRHRLFTTTIAVRNADTSS